MNNKRARSLLPALICIAVMGVAAPAAEGAVTAPATSTPDGVGAAIGGAAIGGAASISNEPIVAPSAKPVAGKPVTVVSDGVAVQLPPTAAGQVSVTSRYSGRKLSLGLPALAGAAAGLSTTGTVTYTDAAHGVALGVSTFDSGVQIASVVSSAQAATSFVYPVALPAGARIQPLDGGGLIFLDADDVPLGGFSAPWAKDANGKAVPTGYQVQGDTVVQTVTASSAAAYPVVADPYLWIDLISSAKWVYHSGDGFTLEVSPTGWARAQAGSYLVGTYDWNELYSKYKNKGLNTNLDGMRDQLICHQQIVAVVSPRKKTWNIDEWRPNVSYAATVNASCNPGGSRIFD